MKDSEMCLAVLAGIRETRLTITNFEVLAALDAIEEGSPDDVAKRAGIKYDSARVGLRAMCAASMAEEPAGMTGWKLTQRGKDELRRAYRRVRTEVLKANHETVR